MKITIKILSVATTYEGKSRTSGLPCKSVEVVGEKPGMRTQKVVFKVFDNSENFTKLSRMDLKVGAIRTMSYSFCAHEYEGKWYNQIDAWDACPADETLLNTQDA